MAYKTLEWEKLYQPHTEFPKCEIDFCQLPSKYDVDIDFLRFELNKVIENYPLKEYPIPSDIPMARGNTQKTFPGYEGICFNCVPGSKDPLYDGIHSNLLIRDHDQYVDEDFTEKTGIWFPYLDDIVNKFNGTVTQIRLICLRAGHNLGEKQHIDYPWYKGIRMHIPLTDGAEYWWNVYGQNYRVYGAQPHIYFLNTGKPHDARNKLSTIDRYVLNINMIPHTTKIPIDQQIQQEIL